MEMSTNIVISAIIVQFKFDPVHNFKMKQLKLLIGH